jgi:hypothetical protein
MPQLQDDPAASLVHGVGGQFPAFHLRVVPDAGRVRVAHALGRDRRGLGDDQAGIGALAVVLGHQRIGHAAFTGAAARERGHDDAVGQRESAELNGVE